jgi:hypothetical protein
MKKTLLFIILFSSFAYTATAQVGFQPHTIIDQGSTNGPSAVFATDLNGDGHLDLVSTSEYDNKIAWYRNDGSGNLGTQQIISLNVLAPKAAHPADFDNDGNIDLLISSAQNSKVVWLRNEGNASFELPRLITNNVNGITNSIPEDIDGDGDLDVIVTSYSDDKIIWFENTNGQGQFGQEILIDNTLERPNKISVSDLDGDGDLDVIASTIYSAETVWFQNLDGQGTFGPKQIIDDDIASTYAVYAFDIDNDGDNDIILNKNSELIYYENLNGQGNFSIAQTIITDDITYFDVEDFDQDGDMDIIGYGVHEINLYENLNGQGTFSSGQTLVSTEIYVTIDLADINGNGNFDLITFNSAFDKISWYPSNAQGIYGSEIILSIIDGVQGSYSVQAADFDGDGNMDVVSANSHIGSISWFKNIDGQGTYSPPKIVVETIYSVQSVFAVDLDGDADMDILSSANDDAQATWYKNIDGQGNFVEQQPFSTDFNTALVVHADDLDADGDMDVIVYASNNGIAWFENLNGQGSFGPAQTIEEIFGYTESIHTVDLDGDGDKDVIVAGYSDDVFAWYENLDGQGNFSTQHIIDDTLSTAIGIYYSDIDGDGDMDILGASVGDDMVVWYENTDGAGTFGPRNVITDSCLSPWLIRTMDADQDGDMDVIVADYSANTVSWYENTNGLGTFGPQQIIDIKMNGVQGMAVGDVNNDGTADLFASSYWGDNLKWYENFGRLGNNIHGTVTLDLDSNGCTSNDAPMKQVMVISNNGTHSFATFTQANGAYQLHTNEGTFTTTLASEMPNYYSPNPSFHTSTFVGQNNTDTGDFCVEPTAVINDLNISYYPLTDARPGFQADYQIVFNNVGTTILDGDVTLAFDDVRLDFLTASEPVSSQTNNTVTFDYTNFKPFETRSIDVSFQVATPPTTQIDDILVYNVTIEPMSGDLTEFDNSFTFEQTVIGSLDPNDIQVLEGESIFIEEADNYVHYIIRFQNTGTASAINVNVSNELDANFDWSTLQIERISHSNRVEITDGNHVEFIFNNINLPDSISNEPESHGYIQYKIKPKSNIAIGDFMLNSAAIYFDFNPPVITNTVITTVIDNLGVEENATNSIALYPVPSIDILNINSKLSIVEAKVFNELGQLLFTIANQRGIEFLNIEQLSTGMYFVKLIDIEQNSSTWKFIKQE